MMTYRGTVQGGGVVLESGAALPEGTEVSIVPDVVPKTASDTEPPQTIGQRLAALGRWAETQPCDLPPDLAANHDHYLHGLPKRT